MGPNTSWSSSPISALSFRSTLTRMHACAHVCVCVVMRACVRACGHARVRTCVRACVRARACVCMCVCACARVCVCARTGVPALSRAGMPRSRLPYTKSSHACMHAHTHKCKHTRAFHACSHSFGTQHTCVHTCHGIPSTSSGSGRSVTLADCIGITIITNHHPPPAPPPTTCHPAPSTATNTMVCLVAHRGRNVALGRGCSTTDV